MRIKHHPEDFRVEERIHLPGDRGAYAYYRVEKRGLTTLAVREMMASKLKVTPSSLTFPALKDAAAVSVQYASVRKRGPERISGKGFTAKRVQSGPRALRPKDLEGNRFTVVARDLSQAKAASLAEVLRDLADAGLPNYFDDQRFGSLSNKGFIGKAILVRDAEEVVRLYLSEPMVGDPRKVRKFKALVRSHWGQWGYLLHQAPRPSNFRSVITYLKDHPHEYRKAANLIKDRLLSIYLSAYQSWVWNRIVGCYFEQQRPDDVPPVSMDIAGTDFPVPDPAVLAKIDQGLEIDLPRLTARYEGAVGEAARVVFEEENLTIRDFKARILRRVYLSKGERCIWFKPDEVEVGEPFADEHNEGNWAVSVDFTLQPGHYATLVLKAAAARIDEAFRAR